MIVKPYKYQWYGRLRLWLANLFGRHTVSYRFVYTNCMAPGTEIKLRRIEASKEASTLCQEL